MSCPQVHQLNRLSDYVVSFFLYQAVSRMCVCVCVLHRKEKWRSNSLGNEHTHSWKCKQYKLFSEAEYRGFNSNARHKRKIISVILVQSHAHFDLNLYSPFLGWRCFSKADWSQSPSTLAPLHLY